MLSTNSLTAFSAATTTSPAHRPKEVRLAREQTAPGPGGLVKNALPKALPSVAPQRGSLLNLSV